MSREQRQAYYFAGKPPELTQEQRDQLPPSEWEAYDQARYNAPTLQRTFGGGNPIGEVMASTRTVLAEQRARESATTGDTEYLPGLPASNADYRGEEHPQLKQYLEEADPGQITEVSDGYHRVKQTLTEVSDILKRAVSNSQHHWEGDAAENARGFLTGLSGHAETNAGNAELASLALNDQAEAAQTAKSNMPEPVEFNLKSEIGNLFTKNPFDMADNASAVWEKWGKHNEAKEQAAQVMTTYDSNAHQSASRQPMFAEPPEFNSQGGSVSKPSGSVEMGSGVTTPSGSVGGPVGTGGGSYAAPTGPSGNAYNPAANLTPGPVTSGGRTDPSAYQLPNQRGGYDFTNPRGGSRNTNNAAGFGPMPMGGMGGMGGAGGAGAGGVGRGMGGAGGMGRGFGPGGSSSGAAPGAGAASGAAKGMGAGAASPGAAAAAGSGSAGARGAAGVGGMGAGRGGGKGEDDQGHQRPTYLVEADPDSVFGTDERTAPPVIGE